MADIIIIETEMESKLKKQLGAFPSSFQTFEYLQKLDKNTKERIADKVMSELNTRDYWTEIDEVDYINDLNFIAFLNFSLRKYDKAIEYNEDVLRRNERNINAIACRAWFHLHRSEFSASHEMCKKLETLKNDNLQLLVAKAEVGYAWSRLGMKNYQEAEQMFNEALEGNIDGESDTGAHVDDNVHVPPYYICTWKFGLALTMKRQLNIHNLDIGNIDCLDSDKERCNKVLKLLLEIIEMEGENLYTQKAMSYVLVGEVLNIRREQPHIFQEQLLNKVVGNDIYEKERFCFHEGLRIQPKNVFVLERCAKYLRLAGKLDKSIELCRRAIPIRETSTLHFYLALALRRKLENQYYKQNKNPNTSNLQNVQHSVEMKEEKSVGPEEIALSKLIKSPFKVRPIPCHKIGDIVRHLDRAIHLNENVEALYDKGLLKRAAGLFDEALEIFKSMFHNSRCSLVNLANAYEQAALCLNDICTVNKTTEEKVRMDMKEYLLKSIEITCNVITKLPQLKHCWNSFPTLKSLLEEEPHDEHNLKGLGQLHHKVRKFSEAIGWYKQALEVETDNHQRACTHMDIVTNCLEVGNYDEAILNIDMVLCFPDGISKVDKNLYFKAHIEGGIKAFAAGQKEVGRIRLKNALNYKMHEQNIDQSHTRDTELEDNIIPKQFDVFILCDQHIEHLGRNILDQLCSIGLDVTLNDEYARAGKLVIEGYANVIDSSRHLLIILGENMESVKHYTGMVDTTQKDRGFGNIVVVLENDEVKVDTMFKKYPSIKYDELFSSVDNSTQHTKELLFMLASGYCWVWDTVSGETGENSIQE